MPQLHNPFKAKSSSSKVPVDAEKTNSKKDTKALKGMSFDEGEASLAPGKSPGDKPKSKGLFGQMLEGGANLLSFGTTAPMVAGLAMQTGRTFGKSANKTQGAPAPAAAAPAQAPAKPQHERGAAMHARVKQQYEPEVAQFLAGVDGLVSTGDGASERGALGDVEFCADKRVNDAMSDEYFAQQAPVRGVGTTADGDLFGYDMVDRDPFAYTRQDFRAADVEAFLKHGLTRDEITAISLYTGGAYGPMNGVLRGRVKDEETIRAYLPWCMKLDSGLAKLPATVRNMQAATKDERSHPLIDKSKPEGEMLDIASVDVHRADKMSAEMKPYFMKQWREGATITNSCFLSTSTRRGGYGDGLGIYRTIRVKDASAGGWVMPVSRQKHENEVLFRPNVQMKIERIALHDDKGGVTHTPDPSAKFDEKTVPEQAWEVQCVIEKAPPGLGKDTGKADASAAPDAKTKQALDASQDAGLAQLLAHPHLKELK